MLNLFYTPYINRWTVVALFVGCLGLNPTYANSTAPNPPSASATSTPPTTTPTAPPPFLTPPPPPTTLNQMQAERFNDYPTQARVEFVFECMNRYGGQNFDTMYGCVCAIDHIAERIPYQNYITTATLATMSNTTGELGNFYREVTGAREATAEFKKFLATTEADCNLKVPKPIASASAAK